MVYLNPQESGLALNCVKVDLTLFCLFLVTSKIVNSYLAFTYKIQMFLQSLSTLKL